MGVQGIAVYTIRAAGFAAVVCGVYALVRRMRGGRLSARRVLTLFYLAALIEITVLRGGVSWDRFFHAERYAVAWVPIRTSLHQLRQGIWPFFYHVGGNLAWFLPLGLILRRKSFWHVLLAGFLLSTVIEGMQWLLLTGITDMDDVFLNTCGAVIGWLLARFLLALRRNASRSERV